MKNIKYVIRGLVQGVGFRPFIAEIAEKQNIAGFVRNSGGVVTVVCRTNEVQMEAFDNAFKCDLPTGAYITSIETEVIDDTTLSSLVDESVYNRIVQKNEFLIVESDSDVQNILPVIPADIATCDRCIGEMFDINNRRYRHPFISCTGCGPRYSILKSLPYDRFTITMSDFDMCLECNSEYVMRKNIRRHAQTIACPKCGPKLVGTYVKAGKIIFQGDNFLTDGNRDLSVTDQYIAEATAVIRNGGIVACKDIGGYHLICNPYDKKAVKRLRTLKFREQKPFAIMFRDMDSIKEYCHVSEMEKELLTSAMRPIVLLTKLENIKNPFSENVVNNSPDIGAMLPCNPLQILLLENFQSLIMTSGNSSKDVLEIDDSAMEKWLLTRSADEKLCDVDFYILGHDRQIVRALDDSIVRVVRDRVMYVRRARGCVPSPIPVDIKGEIFAGGGDLKSTFCFVKDGYAYPSQYLGDMKSMSCQKLYKNEVKAMKKIFGFNPQAVTVDAHPLYFSRKIPERIFEEMKLPIVSKPVEIQHHMAHVAAVIAEHNLQKDVLGFAFDGTGYGLDGSIWGSEVFHWNGNQMERIAHLKPVKLIGGDEGAKNCQTILQGYLYSIAEDLKRAGLEEYIPDTMVVRAIQNEINTVVSTSMGRLFDAVSCLLKICDYNEYEGMAPIELENVAMRYYRKLENTVAMKSDELEDRNLSSFEFDYDCLSEKEGAGKLFVQLINGMKAGVSIEELAFDFINSVAHFILFQAQEYKKNSKIKNVASLNVVFSGGTFLNRILVERAIDLLEEHGFKVFVPQQLPTNDGGICLGQAYLLAHSRT